MKLAFVMTQSLDSPSGLGRYGPLARELAKRGHQVSIFALHPAWNNLSPKRFREEGVDIFYMSQMHVRKEGSRKYYYGPEKLLLVSLLATARLASGLAQCDADIIQLCKPQPFNTLAAKLARRGRPLFCDCDDYEAETNQFSARWQKRFVSYFEDNIINSAKALTTNTRFTQQRYVEMGFPAERIIYVPNGVERKRFKQPPRPNRLRDQWQLPLGAPIVMYVGTLGLLSHPVDLLVEAFARVAQEVPKALLFLVGGGEDFDVIRQKVNRLGIDGRTILTGRVSPDDVPDYLALATVTVDPVHDNLIARARSPLKVVESLAVGTPVVTGDVGDRRDMLANGRLGMLVKAGNSKALAEGIAAILQNAQLRQQMSKEAFASREQWYWDALAHEFEKVYDF